MIPLLLSSVLADPRPLPETAGPREGSPPHFNRTRDNLTNAVGSGFVTVWPCDAPRPIASNLNYTAGATVPNAVVTKLAADGTACLFALTGVDLVVDVEGAFSMTAAYTALTPDRVFDSRDGQTDTAPNLAAGHNVVLHLAGRSGVPADASAVVLNVTVTNPLGAGFVTVWPCDQPRPMASNLNYSNGQTVPNAVVTKLAAEGSVCLFALTAADLVVDVEGAFTATAGYVPVTPSRLLDTRDI